MFFDDYVLNGQAHGAFATGLAQARFDAGMLRPFYDDRGVRCVTLNAGMRYNNTTGEYEPKYQKYPIQVLQARGLNHPVFNAMTLPKQAWIEFDRKIIKATRQRLRAWADLSAANPRGGFNGMARLTLEYQAMSDPGEAIVDMDALTDSRGDRPLLDLKSVPLPITHSGFFFGERELAVSRNSSMPLDTTMAEAAGRRVAEMIEKTLIGTETGLTYGTRSGDASVAHTGVSKVYGYTNFPYRVTKTDLTAPTGSNPEAVMTDILEMIETMQTNGYFGPYMLYHSTPYSRYLNDDYFRTGSTSAVRLLRERIMAIEGIQDIRRLDYLTSGYQLILIQMTSEVAEAINGMDITTVQWQTDGGMKNNFRVMAIQVPLLKAPYNGISGILHGTTS